MIVGDGADEADNADLLWVLGMAPAGRFGVSPSLPPSPYTLTFSSYEYFISSVER